MPPLDTELSDVEEGPQEGTKSKRSAAICEHNNCKYYSDQDGCMLWICKRCLDCHRMWYQYINAERAFNCEEVHISFAELYGGCSGLDTKAE
jgi:hypothetical protein